MPKGEIVQIKDTFLEASDDPTREVDRVYLPKGIVVRHFANLDCEVLYPKGEIAQFNRAELKWTLTNEKGLRREVQDGKSKDLPPINCLKQTEAGTGVVTKMRADRVIMIQYSSGALYCQHPDGTQIYTEAGNSVIRVEKDGFAPVSYRKSEKAETDEDWFDPEVLRSIDGIIIEVELPDSSKVKSFKAYKSTADTTKTVTKHLYMREDYSAFMIDSEGDFRVITTNARQAINDADERTRLGNDTDYLNEIYIPNGTYTPGVYHGRVCWKAELNSISVRDSERPFCYLINGANKLEKRNYEKFERNEDWVPLDLGQSFEGNPEVEPINIGRNPFSRSFLFPRMFIVSPSGEGLELLCQDQLDDFVRNNQSRPDTLTTSRVEQVDQTQMNSIQVMNKITSLQEVELKNHKISARLRFPEYAEPYVIQMRSDDHVKKMKPLQDQYQFRNLTEYSAFDPLKQQAFFDDLGRFNEWKSSQVRYDTEFGIVHQAGKDGSLDLDEQEDNEYFWGKINNKIYRERAQVREPFSRSVFKANFEKAWNTDSDIVGFRKRMTSVKQEEEMIAANLKARADADKMAAIQGEQRAKDEAVQNQRNALKAKTRAHVDNRLRAFEGMKETPSFAGAYHRSRSGQEYFRAHPVKPPSDEVLMRMSQRINRSQHNGEKGGQGQSMFDGASQRSGRSGERNGQQNPDKDNPIVALEPEDQLKQASVDKSKKFTSASKTHDDFEGMDDGMQGPIASLYMQEKVYLKQLEQERVLKAEEHHVVKTKDFDVFGKLRQAKPFVKATQKSNMPSELNEKFITTESITDRRVKISSMANRQYTNAPGIEQVRKQGQHQMIMQAIEKKQTFSELINQANSMVTSVLHDTMKRSINILPSVCVFGVIKQGEVAELTVSIKNEDALSQRVHIKPCQDKRLLVKQESYGPIAPGMMRKLLVTINTSADEQVGKLREEVAIVTKADIFKMMVEAEIVTAEEFEQRNQEKMSKTNNRLGITNSRVRTKLRSAIGEGKKQTIAAAQYNQETTLGAKPKKQTDITVDAPQEEDDEDMSAQSFQ